MKMTIASVTFLIVSGVFSLAMANEPAPTAAPATEPAVHAGGHAEHSIGVKQPEVDRSKATLPGHVTLAEPKALAKVSGTVTLKWAPVEGAEVYHVQVAKDARFKWLVSNEYDVKGETFQVPTLEAGQYFWRVAARRPANDAQWTHGYFSNSSFEVK